MTFIKLSFAIINKSHISWILIKHDRYKVYLNSNKFSGFNSIFGGYISSDNDIIEILKTDEKDYKKFEDWILHQL